MSYYLQFLSFFKLFLKQALDAERPHQLWVFAQMPPSWWHLPGYLV